MEWTKDATIRLVEMFREKPELWDTAGADYRNKIKKQIAWSDIANCLGIGVKEVEKKMRVLIGQFQREEKKLIYRYGYDEAKESKWFCYKHLSFLKGKYKPRQSIENALGVKVESQEDESQESSTTEEYFSRISKINKIDNVSIMNESSDDNYAIQDFKCESGNFEHNFRRSKDNDTAAVTVQPILSNNLDKDEFDTFGEYVAIVLRKLKTDYAKCTVKYHMNNILYQGEIGTYDCPPSYDFSSTNPSGSSSGSASYVLPATSSQESSKIIR